MSIYRVSKNKNNPYVMIDKRSISNDKLSWKAKGILAYVLSMPDDWIFYASELIKHSIDGETALRSGLKELEEAGYITKKQTRTEDGKISGYEWIIHELPTISRKSICGQPKHGKPSTTNNDNTNNDNTNLKDYTHQIEPSLNRGGDHKKMISTLGMVCGLDLKIRRNAGRLARAVKELRMADYTASDIDAFLAYWKAKDWRWKKNKSLPTPEQVLEGIAKIRIYDTSEEYMKTLEEKRVVRRSELEGIENGD